MTKTVTIRKATVTGETRIVRLLKRVREGGEEVVKGAIRKVYYDVTLTIFLTNGGKASSVFTGHVFKGECRVIIRGGGLGGKDLSMSFDDFKRHVDRQWGYDKWCRAEKVKREFTKFFGK